jgi:transposase-like protein
VRDDFVGAFQTLAKARSDFEERHIAAALARTGGKMAEAARLLGISRVALHRRIKQHGALYSEFRREGTEVVAISVDPPQRSAAMRRDMKLDIPVLSDSSREVITSWGLLNASEKGGIAFPATFLIDRNLKVRFSSAGEGVIRRIPASEMLEMARAVKAGRSADPCPQEA